MPKYTCERCLKEFSQKSHYDKHLNKKNSCQDNKGHIEVVVENIIIKKKLISNNTENNIINKKLISNNTENNIITTMEAKPTNTTQVIEFKKMKLKELILYCKEHKIKGFSTKKKK